MVSVGKKKFHQKHYYEILWVIITNSSFLPLICKSYLIRRFIFGPKFYSGKSPKMLHKLKKKELARGVRTLNNEETFHVKLPIILRKMLKEMIWGHGIALHHETETKH